MSEELFDVVDADDQVLYPELRSVVHRDHLRHRAVQILVFDLDDRLLVHRRAASKDEFPLLFNTSASGHVSSGESYEEAAVRELREELGLESEIEFLAKFPATKETSWEHTWLCRTVIDLDQVKLVPCPIEIIELRWQPLSDLQEWIAKRPDEFTPGFRLLFAWLREFLGQ